MTDLTRYQSELDDGYEFRVVRDRFMRINRERLARIRGDLRAMQQDALQLLPLLFHVNHPLLPGYVANGCPAGIPDYTPSGECLAAARRLARGFELKKRAYRKFDIQALYLMGSTGTIAYSDKSDIDVWLCHDPALSAEQLDNLRAKAHGVEQWARSLDLEMHLFLVDPQRFSQDEQVQISSESSGSALHYLLLEEFYRTGVLLAGRYPLWWLVPPGKEGKYDEVVAEIKRKRFAQSRDHIDFGGLCRIKSEEFYGAALWMLYKGINSPYKSMLKTLLMEAYASEYPDIDLLCQRYKRAVYEDAEIDVNRIDPYVMMLRKAEEYLLAINQQERLELLRRSFYIKVDERISRAQQSTRSNWRRELLEEIVDDWGWHHSRIAHLDAREQWRLGEVMRERKGLIGELTATYRFITEFSRLQGDSTTLIKPEDLHVLGRKLYAAFERKAGKIEIVYQGVVPDLYETHLSFHRLLSEDGDAYWMVFPGTVSAADIELATPLQRSFSLIELIAWCYFNKIINHQTLSAVYTHNGDLTTRELKLVVDNMCRLFPEQGMVESSIYDLRQPACIKMIGSFINVGVDPFAAHSRHGRQLTSDRTDALKYGGRLENLALSFDQVIVTSWREVLTFRYLGVAGLMKCLQDYIKWAPPSSGRRPPPINASSYSSYRGHSIAQRIESLFAEVIGCFYDAHPASNVRFVLGIEWQYYVLEMDNDGLKYQNVGEYADLLHYLAAPLPRFSQVIFDRETLVESVLPVIFAHNHPGMIQCFYEIRGEQVCVYILDEKATLTIQTKPFQDILGLVRHYQEFFESIRERMLFLGQDALTRDSGIQEVEFYRIDSGADQKKIVRRHSVNMYFKPAGYLSVQAIVTAAEGRPVFSLFCDDREFSTLEHGRGLYRKVALYILGLRHSGERYPIYITDIDLSPALIDETSLRLQTAHYLEYKKLIEDRLLQELQADQ